jgi:hypothetical protein
MKRILPIAVAVALLIVLAPANASPARASGAVQCRDASITPRQVGAYTANVPMDGVKAQFRVTNGIYPDNCTGLDVGSATGWWVAAQPRTMSNGNEIIQLGQMKCKAGGLIYPGANPCEPSKTNTWRLFYAYGGCSSHAPWPRDLGAASSGSHHYQITWASSGIIFRVDGVTRVTIPFSEMDCWPGGAYSGVWGVTAVETWDAGDGAGGSSTNPVSSDTWVRISDSNYVWDAHVYYGTTCSENDYPDDYFCSAIDGGPLGGNTLNFWTRVR